MKRSLLVAAAAVSAIALLTGCSASTEAPEAKPEVTAPVEEATPGTPGSGEENAKPEPPKGYDQKLAAFVDVAVASCEKARAEGVIAKTTDGLNISVPAEKAINKVTDVFIAVRADGKTANYLPPVEVRTGQPMPYVCSISGSAYQDLMDDGKSDKFSESNGTWIWNETDMKVTVTAKDNLIAKYTQEITVEKDTFNMTYDVTYGLSEADYKQFEEAVANPTDPNASN